MQVHEIVTPFVGAAEAETSDWADFSGSVFCETDAPFVRRRLLLVTRQQVMGPDSDASTSTLLTHALLLSEYAASKDGLPIRVYVEKADSSGVGQLPQGHPHSRISPLAHALSNCLATLAAQCSSLSVHVFARPQPQYLFPNSASNTNKRILSDTKLTLWWVKALSLAVNRIQIVAQVQIKKFLLVPGQDASHALKHIADPSWTYGLGFGCFDSNPSHQKIESMPAAKLVPQFPDDAKTKGLRLLPKGATIGDLQEVLAATGECATSVTGFLGVFIEKSPADKSDSISLAAPANPDEAKHNAASEQHKASTDNENPAPAGEPENLDAKMREWSQVRSTLMSLDFSSFGKIETASATILDVLMSLKHVQYKCLDLNSDIPDSDQISSKTGQAVQAKSALAPAAGLVNNLQGLVKKRKPQAAPTSVPVSGAANDLQGLVKRKKNA
ncbi:histone acetylation protein-domain-containing protein [Chytriomyces cf. hyalinus JEL632]|nr:histone acetylation protein-domain-containing protein [Chytriomyces cf. hyalinus JEL632]